MTSRQESDDGAMVIVKDPVTERFFRFKEVEAFILEHLDGATSPEWISGMVSEKFGAEVSPDHIRQFTERLRRIGFLEDQMSVTSHAHSSRLRGDPFYLRVKLFDPDRLFDRLISWLRPLFTPGFVALSALLIVLALGVTVANWGDIVREARTLFRLESLLFLWVVMMVVVTLHEFAHGLTCKQFGGQVHEMGFMLIYLQPAFYCNVSDAWLFPKKSQRLWVTFAGAYFETFLWALATLSWRVTDPSTTINHVSLVVMTTSGIKSLFNLNPLIKLDGYYLLSDYLSIPNLRRNAFTYLGDRFRALVGSPVRRLKSSTKRERKIYLLYSVLAGAYSYWLFGLILLGLANFLISRLQGWGFVLFLVSLSVIFRHPISRLLRMDSSRPTNGTRKIHLSRKVKIGIGFVVLLLIAIFLPMELKVGGEFVILPVDNADVRAEVAGIIEKISFDQGDDVEQGMTIVQLSDREYRAELGKVKAQVDEKEAKLKLLKAGTRREELVLARTQVEKAEERLKYATKDLEMDRVLRDKEIISAKLFAQSEGTFALRRKELQEAHDHLAILLAGSRKEEIDAIQAEISSLRAQELFLDQQLEALTIKSPITGVITTHKLKEKIGQHVEKGDLIAEVHELNTVEAEIAVPEKEIADVVIGQTVVLKARAFPSMDFEGKVTSIAPVVTKLETPGQERNILVITRLSNPSLLLKPEMSGNAKIYCGDRRLIELLARRFVRFFRVEFWSWW